LVELAAEPETVPYAAEVKAVPVVVPEQACPVVPEKVSRLNVKLVEIVTEEETFCVATSVAETIAMAMIAIGISGTPFTLSLRMFFIFFQR
jgi:hypothetical protein